MIIKKLLFLLPIYFLAHCLIGNTASEVQKKKPSFPSKEEILKKFDTDGDGKLNEEERKKVRNEMASRRSSLPPLLAKKFDKDGDGELSEEERAAFRKEMASKGRKLPPHLMQRFDKDGDGTLSDEERSAAKQEWENRKSTMLEKFDADGDGTLSVEERREAIKQARLNREGGKVPAEKDGVKEVDSGNSESKKKGKKAGKGAKKKDKKKDS